MTPTSLKEIDYLKAWALFAISSTVGGFIAGAIVGGILGAALGASGMPATTIKPVCGLGGLLAGLPVSYLIFRECVSRLLIAKALASPPTTAVEEPR